MKKYKERLDLKKIREKKLGEEELKKLTWETE